MMAEDFDPLKSHNIPPNNSRDYIVCFLPKTCWRQQDTKVAPNIVLTFYFLPMLLFCLIF